MQLPAQPPALVLDGGDEPLAAALELGRELVRASGGSRLPYDVGEQPLVGPAQPRPRAALGEQEPADLLVAVGDRQGPAGDRPVAVLDEEQLARRLPELHPDVRDAKGVRDRLGHHEQLGVRRRRLLQPASEGGHDRVRVVALAEEPDPDQPPQLVAQRRVDRGHHERRQDERLVAVEPLAEERPDEPEDEQVDGEGGGEERDVDERPAEQPLDVDELGADHADRDADRGRHHRDRQPPRDDRRGRNWIVSMTVASTTAAQSSHCMRARSRPRERR